MFAYDGMASAMFESSYHGDLLGETLCATTKVSKEFFTMGGTKSGNILKGGKHEKHQAKANGHAHIYLKASVVSGSWTNPAAAPSLGV